MEPVTWVLGFWRYPLETRRAVRAEECFRELAKVEGWTVLVTAKGLAKVLEQGELAAPERSERGEVPK